MFDNNAWNNEEEIGNIVGVQTYKDALIINTMSDFNCSLAKEQFPRWIHGSWGLYRQTIIDKVSQLDLSEQTGGLVEWFLGLCKSDNLKQFFLPDPTAFQALIDMFQNINTAGL
jgi:hypothetical protein